MTVLRRASVPALAEVDWQAVAATDFRDPDVKEGKQAEFLVHGSFPWQLVRRIGIRSATMQTKVAAAIAKDPHKVVLEVRPEWYF